LSFEITKGDYGRIYRAIIEKIDLSDCEALMFVWDKNKNLLVNGGSCSVTFASPDTFIDYVVQQSDFEKASSGVCDALIRFEKAGVVERTIKFNWRVYDKEP